TARDGAWENGTTPSIATIATRCMTESCTIDVFLPTAQGRLAVYHVTVSGRRSWPESVASCQFAYSHRHLDPATATARTQQEGVRCSFKSLSSMTSTCSMPLLPMRC